MPLDKILSELDEPVHPKVKTQIFNYIKNLSTDHETLAVQCAARLEKSDSLGTVLAIVHALNEGEFLLKCRDEDVIDNDLSREFDALLADPKKD